MSRTVVVLHGERVVRMDLDVRETCGRDGFLDLKSQLRIEGQRQEVGIGARLREADDGRALAGASNGVCGSSRAALGALNVLD